MPMGQFVLICACVAVFAGRAVTEAHAAILQSGDIVVAAYDVDANGMLFRVDPATGEREVISGATRGQGVEFEELEGITWSGGAIYAVDQGFLKPRVVRIDPATGDRTVVSQSWWYEPIPEVGGGPGFNSPTGITTDADGSLLVVGGGFLTRVDPVTGDRTVVSSDEMDIGAGPSLPAWPNYGIEISPQGDVFVTSWFDHSIMRVDPVTGDRFEFSGAWAGSDSYLAGMAIDPSGRMFVQTWLDGVQQVDPVTGRRSKLYGEGEAYGGYQGDIDVDLNGDLIVASSSIYRVDPNTGDRYILSDIYHGEGVWFTHPHSLLVVPVPEPAALIYAASGMAIIFVALGRRAP